MRRILFATVLSILTAGAMPAAAQGLVPGVTVHGPANGVINFYPGCCFEHNPPVQLSWAKQMSEKDHAKMVIVFNEALSACQKLVVQSGASSRNIKIGMAYCMNQRLRQNGLDYVQATPDDDRP